MSVPVYRPPLPALIAGTLAWLALAGCSVFLRDTPAPIPTQSTMMSASGRAETLVVFLPGRGDSMEDTEREGLVAILRESGVRADAVVVDAHLGYYFDRTVIERLRADVLLPARRQGYRRIVLVGVSLGGLGGMLCDRDFPGSVDALVLLAPFLGGQDTIFERIDAAGGLVAWAKGRDPLVGTVEEQVWTFLGTRMPALPPTWLLSGTEDRYARGHRLFATLLPAERVTTIPGGHEWPVWRSLWREVCLHSDAFATERAGTPFSPKTKK